MSFNPIDVFVGGRVKERRKSLKLTQQDLAKALGLTFQQVQKYERGANRISASKLYKIGETLDISISYFFEGIDANESTPVEGFAEETIAYADTSIKDVMAFAGSEEGVELNQAFSKVKDSKIRKYLVGLFDAISEAKG
jgi:transcriptional regulator with XRE-family HTH domain